MAEQDQKKRRDPHVFDDAKLRLYGNPIQPDGRKISLKIKLSENNPVIEVDYGIRNNKDMPVKHDTPMSPVILNSVVVEIKRACRAKGQYAIVFDNWGHPFIYDREQGKSVRSPDRMNISRLEVGKTENGVVYLKYISPKKPELEFQFGEDEWHKLLQADGTPLPISGQSAIMAEAWAETIKQVYLTYYATKWEEPEWRKRFRLEQAAKFGNNGGGFGGGNNSNGYQQNNFQQSKPAPQQAAVAASYSGDDNFDEDIPF